MAYRLVVRTEAAGREWPDDLVLELDKGTDTMWVRDPAREDREAGDRQGGVTEIILTAAVTAIADDAFEALTHQVHVVLDRLRKNRYNPPEVSVVVEEIPAPEPAESGPAAPQEGAGRPGADEDA
jgi:hypothetical protein